MEKKINAPNLILSCFLGVGIPIVAYYFGSRGIRYLVIYSIYSFLSTEAYYIIRGLLDPISILFYVGEAILFAFFASKLISKISANEKTSKLSHVICASIIIAYTVGMCILTIVDSHFTGIDILYYLIIGSICSIYFFLRAKRRENMTCKDLKNRGYNRGLKWYNFYTYIRMPFGFVFSVLGILGDISTASLTDTYYYSAYASISGWIWLGIILEIVTFCLRIAAFRRLCRFDHSSFSVNNALLLFECIVAGYSTMLTRVNTSVGYGGYYYTDGLDSATAVSSFFITFSMLLFIWLLPNYVYFKKRRDLFDGLYSLIPSQEILARLNEIADNPEAIKAIAKDMRNANEINSNEYWYIIEHYIDTDKPAVQDKSLYEQPKSYEHVVSLCNLLGSNTVGIKDVLSKALSSGAISSEQYVELKAKYIQGMTDVEIPDVTTASSSQKETQTAETLEDRLAPSQTAQNQEQNPTVKSEAKEGTKTESQFDKDIDAHPVLSYILLGFGPILWLVAVGMLFAKGNDALGAMLLIVVPLVVILWLNRNKLKSKTTGQSDWQQTTVFRSEQDAPCCKHCGAKLIEGASFCNKCGQKLD